MSLYRRISCRMWGDAKYRALSSPAPNAQTLWIYLLCGEHTTAIPGVIRAGEATLAESLGWPVPAFRKAFAEVYAKGMATPDWSSRLVFLPNSLKHNPPQSPKVVIAWRKAFEELPEGNLKVDIYHAVKAYLEGFSEAFQKAFDVALPDSLSESLSQRHPDIAEIEETDKETKVGKPPGKADYLVWFDSEFIPAFPTKGRSQYKSAVSRLCEIKPDVDQRAGLMALLGSWKATDNWIAGQYIPGLATFLTDPKYRQPPIEDRPLPNGKAAAPLPPTADDYYRGAQ
jgi:hypothetical protein